MENQISEPLKAILIKVAIELKKLGWIPDSQTNEIDVFQGHIGMSKEHIWDKDANLPNVDVDIGLDLRFEQNIQNQVFFLVYDIDYRMFIQSVGGDDRRENSDVDVPFTEQDVNNIAKFQEAAKKINTESVSAADRFAYEFAQESYQDWKSGKQNKYASEL
jgi:hypothetical protein